MTGALTAAASIVAATTPKKSSGFPPIIIIYAVIAAGFYFLYYRPRKRKAQVVREQANAWDVGDEVLTAGGIVGHIIEIDGDRITLETSVGASFVVLRQYVLRKIEPVVADEDEYDEDEGDDEDLELEEAEVHDEAADATTDDVDEEHAGHEAEAGDDTTTGPEAAPGPGNRRSRRRGLRNQSGGSEDPSDNDGPPAA